MAFRPVPRRSSTAGQPIAGLAPARVLLLGQPHGPVTFTAYALGVTAELSETFP